ncbi:Uncharacterized protein TCM_014187 [Theobroma cacao]|uniref:Uncharacterized protein n=1 Tax=Theobroma cacao TaxID=3641 RepID=A0A061FY78_THECC|nr:Uncharacterized protein TCM_014187 [Theobroma cacao]
MCTTIGGQPLDWLRFFLLVVFVGLLRKVVSYLIRVKDYTRGPRIGVYLLLVQLRIGSRLSIASRSKFRSCILESKVIDLNLLSYLGAHVSL